MQCYANARDPEISVGFARIRLGYSVLRRLRHEFFSPGGKNCASRTIPGPRGTRPST